MSILSDMTSIDRQYDAFISYCHHPTDRRWAKWLQRKLETYRTPTALRNRGVPARLRRIFRDEDELAASADLGERIDQALRASKFLVVVCSPRTPQSRWVREEIERFAGMGRADSIVALLVEGDPVSAFPSPLLQLRTVDGRTTAAEPLAADVRPQQDESARRRRQHAGLKVLAAILGVEFDELRQREQERALRRMALLAALSTIGLALLASLSVIAWTQRQEAIRRLGDSLIAQADSRQSLYRPGVDALYADAIDAFTASGTNTGVAELALIESFRFSPPPLAVLTGHAGVVSRALLAPDGRRVISAGIDGTVRQWNLATQTQSSSWHISQAAIVDMAMLSDARHVVYATSSGTIAVADLDDGKVDRQIVSGRAGLARVAASPDGRFVAWGGTHGLLEVADLVDGTTRTLRAHPGDVTGLRFYTDGHLLISSSSEHAVRLWNPLDGRELRVFDFGTLIFGDLVPVPDGRGIVVGRSGLNLGAYVWDLANSFPSVSFDTHGPVNPGDRALRVVQTNAVAVSPDTHFSERDMGYEGEVAIGGDGGHVVVWDPARRNEPRAVLIAHTGRVTSLAYSADGRYLASAGSDGSIMVWPRSALLGTASALLPYSGFTRSTAISHDGTMVAAGGDDGVLQIWDRSARRLLRSATTGHGITKVAFSLDDQFIVYKGVNSEVIYACQFADDRTSELKGHTDVVTDFAFMPGSGRLLTASRDRTLRLWTPGTHTTQRVFTVNRMVRAVAALRDGAVVLVDDSGDLVLFDLDQGREVWSVHLAGSKSPRVAVLTDDLIASGESGGKIRLSDSKTGRERLTLSGHEDEVTALVGFGGRWLLSTSWDHTLRVWDTESGALVRTIRLAEMFGFSLALAPDRKFVVAGGDSPVRMWPLLVPPKWIRYRRTLNEATANLAKSGNDGQALRTLGEWYANVGDAVLATELLERAEKAGATVAPTELAPLHWITGHYQEARSDYDRALQAGQITQSFHRLRSDALAREQGNLTSGR